MIGRDLFSPIPPQFIALFIIFLVDFLHFYVYHPLRYPPYILCYFIINGFPLGHD